MGDGDDGDGCCGDERGASRQRFNADISIKY